MENFPYVALLVAGVVNMILGMLWYSPALFGDAWMKMAGITKKDMEEAKKKGMAGVMVAGYLTALVVAWGLWYFMGQMGTSTMQDAAVFGATVWVFFNAPVLIGMVLWENKPFKLYAINSGYWLVSFVLMSLVVSAF